MGFAPEGGDRVSARRFIVVTVLLTVTLLVGLLSAAPAGAIAPTSASCIGQFFSSHAGLGAAHTGETVGSFTSGAARELGGEFGATISGARALPREDCGL
jgi:hypothetical protein